MNDRPLIKEFHYDAPVEAVWQALTTTDAMQVWYFPQLRAFEPVVGFAFQFNDDGDEYQKVWTVIHVDEGKTLVHSWTYKGYPGISEVRFDIVPEAGTTRLRVTHTGIDRFPDDSHFKRERFEWGWDTLLGQNLQQLLQRKDLQ